MDNRISLRIPDNYAYILRTGGGYILPNDFHTSYTVAVGGVSHFAIIGHSNCGMVNLAARKELFINGLVKRGSWSRKEAEEHFAMEAPRHEIINEVDYVINETQRLRQRYPTIKIAPLMYLLEDHLLYLVKEG
jgi:carbonic anhydrase